MASKNQTIFFCKECGYETAKWLGQCPGCKEWNTMVEAPTVSSGIKSKIGSIKRNITDDNKPMRINEIPTGKDERMTSGFSEFDRVLGGGIVKGSLMLIGGDPGIGKSTLILQVCNNVSASGKKVLYISGEESLSQIKIRADRLNNSDDKLLIYAQTDISKIKETVLEIKPDVIVIDSIQTMYSEGSDLAPGSPGQIKESTMELLRLAKDENVAVFIIGHVTKEGVVAGPRMLEHMVDAVLYLEGDKNDAYRILRGVKNRFGATNEIGVFEMSGSGMTEILNPSEYMLNGRAIKAPGSVVTSLMEGTRPVMVEIQALVGRSNFGIPRRTASGTDYNRVNLLMAVLEKRSTLNLAGYDAYVNVAGGIKATEPSIDLAIIMAVAGSYKNKELPDDTVVFGEVGLSGEVRSVAYASERINEAKKLKFKRVIMPKSCIKKKDDDIELIGVSNINEAIDIIH